MAVCMPFCLYGLYLFGLFCYSLVYQDTNTKGARSDREVAIDWKTTGTK